GLTQLGSYALIRKSQPISLINQDQRGTSLPLMRNQGRESQREAWSHAAHRRHASYPGLIDYRHDPRIVGKRAGHVVLPWIHRAFSLMKRWGLGTYHGLRRTHVDTHLNEFVFRYNRR